MAVKQGPKAATPASFDLIDRTALLTTLVALLFWAIEPEMRLTSWLELVAASALVILLALVADAFFTVLQRVLTPWARVR